VRPRYSLYERSAASTSRRRPTKLCSLPPLPRSQQSPATFSARLRRTRHRGTARKKLPRHEHAQLRGLPSEGPFDLFSSTRSKRVTAWGQALARLSPTLPAHLANRLAASGFVLPHRITPDMPWSSSSPGDQSITQSDPPECDKRARPPVRATIALITVTLTVGSRTSILRRTLKK
jgi:hypothetical protein